jgi:hypothetical protein
MLRSHLIEFLREIESHEQCRASLIFSVGACQANLLKEVRSGMDGGDDNTRGHAGVLVSIPLAVARNVPT